VKITDFIATDELLRILAKASRISGSAVRLESTDGVVVGARPDDGATDGQAEVRHKSVLLAHVRVCGGTRPQETAEWVAEEIRERHRSRAEVDDLAQHVSENYQELNYLFDVVQRLPPLTGMDTVGNCSGILQATTNLLEARRSWMLIGKDGSVDLVRIALVTGETPQRDSYGLDSGRPGPWEYAYRTGEAINAACLEDLPSGTDLRTDLGLCLPLLCTRLEADSKPLGVFCLAGKLRGDFFTSTEAKLVNTIGAYLASVLSNAHLYEKSRRLFIGAVTALANAIESRDEYTHGHVERVMQYAEAIGRELGFDREHLELLHVAALMHDLGKIGIPDEILKKRGTLSPEERKTIESHALVGPRILKGFGDLEPVIPWIQAHHERPDGTGYPQGLQGSAIPLEAQILAVADAFDAMTTTRTYHQAIPFDEGARRLLEGVGTQFSPQVVEAFLRSRVFSELPRTPGT
jgi:putative nucleotidyltransferase with HDIG domain